MTTTQLRIVIVGGVAGGATAAARARRANARAEITILEKGPVISFANCGLPYHLGGEIARRESLLVATSKLFWDRFRIRVCTGHEVLAIDRAAKCVAGKTSQGETFSYPYDKLIVATGSEPIRPDFCNVTADNLFQLWTLSDMDLIVDCLSNRTCKRATVIGAGFVGLEVVEQLVQRGLKVDLIERLPQVLGPLDAEMARLVQAELERHEVNVKLNTSVRQLRVDQGRVVRVEQDDGQLLDTNLVIVGAGVRPRTQLAASAGLEIGSGGGVVVNRFCQTSDPDIYAVGDVIEYHHGALGQPMRVPLAGPANRSGRVAGGHAACGHGPLMPPVQGTSIVRVFDVAAGLTGLSERLCAQRGIAYRCATIQAGHHAGYFPGAKNLTLKLVYCPQTRRVLGAQAVGAQGIDKRLDVVATLLHFSGTVDDLAGLDLAYAPPFGSAKDPVHMAAFVAQNDLADYPQLAPAGASLAGIQVVDVRNDDEISKLPLPDAIAIPVDSIVERWQELDPHRQTIVVCHSGKRAHVAASWLKGQGFQDVKNLNGGMSIRQLVAPTTERVDGGSGGT
ncbi:MAG: FAD-dependent oxidoreductase [Pirellulaceae bacterium]|nr:FAD-dependent oxidoreductase [Pirellulaceae bacterium]